MNFFKNLFTRKLLALIIAVLAVVLILLLVGVIKAQANPFLVCDPQAGVTQYKLITDGGEILIPAEPDGSVKWDIAGLANGVHPMQLLAGAAYMLNGQAQEPVRWSNPVPFDLSVPAVSTPVGIGLSP